MRAFAGLVITTYLEDFRGVAGVDVVSRSRASITGKDGEVVASNTERRTAIVCIATIVSQIPFRVWIVSLTGKSYVL